MAYLDRPLADFFEAHVRHTGVWYSLDRGARALDLPVVAALFFLLACSAWVTSGRRLRAWTRTPLLCSRSAMLAVAAVLILKHIFGRGDADPTYIHYRMYGFRFLHSSANWEAFPSGTAGISTAMVSVLWITIPRLRVIGFLIVAFLAAWVVFMNYHWLSDVIAGTLLGAFIGWSTVRFQRKDSTGTDD